MTLFKHSLSDAVKDAAITNAAHDQMTWDPVNLYWIPEAKAQGREAGRDRIPRGGRGDGVRPSHEIPRARARLQVRRAQVQGASDRGRGEGPSAQKVPRYRRHQCPASIRPRRSSSTRRGMAARHGSEPDRVPEPYMAKLCVAHSRHWRSAQLSFINGLYDSIADAWAHAIRCSSDADPDPVYVKPKPVRVPLVSLVGPVIRYRVLDDTQGLLLAWDEYGNTSVDFGVRFANFAEAHQWSIEKVELRG